MVLSLSESWSSFKICLEKLMGEVLGKDPPSLLSFCPRGLVGIIVLL